MSADDKELERLTNEKNKHKGDWLTDEAVAYYQKKAKNFSQLSHQDVGAKRALRHELQERFGLLEIEAINIINGFYAKYYIEKYRRIKACMPLQNDTGKSSIESED